MTEICVVGLGYIGLPTAAMFATHGFRVLGVDKNPSVVSLINGGNTPIEEPGLKTLLEAAVKSGNLTAQSQVQPADAYVVAVPTPVTEDQRPDLGDLGDLTSACRSIAAHLRRNDLVVIESTVPPGATLNTVAPLLEESGLKAGTEFSLAHCRSVCSPERSCVR